MARISKKQKAIELLDKAYVLLNKPRGWGKGAYSGARPPRGRSHSECYCLTGALASANSSYNFTRASQVSHLVISELLHTVGPQNGLGLIGWNDSPERTKKEVLLAIKTTRDRLAAE